MYFFLELLISAAEETRNKTGFERIQEPEGWNRSCSPENDP